MNNTATENTTKTAEQTQQAISMFGMDYDAIEALTQQFIIPDNFMIGMSIASDMQEEIEHDLLTKEQMRQKLNLIKYFMSQERNSSYEQARA